MPFTKEKSVLVKTADSLEKLIGSSNSF